MYSWPSPDFRARLPMNALHERWWKVVDGGSTRCQKKALVLFSVVKSPIAFIIVHLGLLTSTNEPIVLKPK